ncbi:hypothetical protein O5D80_006017 [Batrachochytrium dendrobatidis]|nr:hypothetical protein O5D80_006017 [Batrachochytrium dendrobatidis]
MSAVNHYYQADRRSPYLLDPDTNAAVDSTDLNAVASSELLPIPMPPLSISTQPQSPAQHEYQPQYHQEIHPAYTPYIQEPDSLQLKSDNNQAYPLSPLRKSEEHLLEQESQHHLHEQYQARHSLETVQSLQSYNELSFMYQSDLSNESGLSHLSSYSYDSSHMSSQSSFQHSNADHQQNDSEQSQIDHLPVANMFEQESIASIREYFKALLNFPKKALESSQTLIEFLLSSIIQTAAIDTPFGIRPLVIADFTTIGRPLRCVEEAVQTHILAHYGSVQTGTSGIGLSFMSKKLITFSNTIVKASFGAETNDYACLFTDILPRRFVEQLIRFLDVSPLLPEPQAPILLVSAAEDPVNLHVWIEAGAYVVPISINAKGVLSLHDIQDALKTYQTSLLVIGFFPAVCDATGVIQPVKDISTAIHKANRLVFFDYTTAAPYIDTKISGSVDQLAWPDGAISTSHNLLGGPNARSFILVKKNLVLPIVAAQNGVPAQREFLLSLFDTGSKPDMIANVRAGFACTIKSLLNSAHIQWRQLNITATYIDRFRLSNLIVIGLNHSNRLPIFSFVIKGPEGKKLLHYRFVARLLNDLFGIQTWSGMTSASNYHFDCMKLGISHQDGTIQCFSEVENAYRQHASVDPGSTPKLAPIFDCILPGFVRVDLSFIQTTKEIDYITDAIEWIARDGYTLLPLYEPQRSGADWTISKNLPIDHPDMPLRPHTRKRQFDIKKYVMMADDHLQKHWHKTQFQQVAGMTKHPDEPLYYRNGRGSLEADGSVVDMEADPTRVEGFYLTRQDVNDYLVRSGRLRVGFSHVPLMKKARWAVTQAISSIRLK